MGKKKSTSSAVSKVSSATAPSANVSNKVSNKSSILRSSFAPSSLQLHLFASVIQSFESQQLRIHDTNTGRLRQQHDARPGVTITSLSWGYYGAAVREQYMTTKKKRKRSQLAAEDAVVAYGTSDGDVCMFSPADGRLVGHLKGAHEKGTKDFQFVPDSPLEGWSIGGDGKLVQWDLSKDQPLRSMSLPDPAVSILASPSTTEPAIVCASTTSFSIDFSSSDDFRIETYDAFKNVVTNIIRSGAHSDAVSEAFLAVDNDRFVNVFDIAQKKLVRTLVLGSEAERTDLYTPPSVSKNVLQDQVLAVVTRDGTVELFAHPFISAPTTNGDLKSKIKRLTRKADAQIKLLQQDTKKSVAALGISFQGADLVLVSVTAGVEPSFQKIRWQDEGTGGLLFEGVKEVPYHKSSTTLNSAKMNGVKDMGKSVVDESRTVVVNGAGEVASEPAIEISSDEQDDDVDTDEEEDNKVIDGRDQSESEDSDAEMDGAGALITTGENEGDLDEDMADAPDHEPTFGERLAAKHPTTITIADAFVSEDPTLNDATKQLAIPSGMSLGTVLTQALRTNDQNLLESCLHANDTGIIQNTIQRLDSGLASILLSKLAERLASRPGRYGHLLSWVQWTCIAHGGAIAGQPDVAAKIKILYKVLAQRSKSFDKLLLLKGKLDMLDAQLTFRQQLQQRRGGRRDDQDEPGMIYIEGQEDNWSSEDNHDEVAGAAPKLGFKTKRPLSNNLDDLIGDEESSGEEEDMPMTNGNISDDSGDDDDEDDEVQVNGLKAGGILDVEAEVSGEEDLSEEEGAGDDIEGSDGDDDDDEEDSEMDDFINDGSVDYASSDELDGVDDTPPKPAVKRSKQK